MTGVLLWKQFQIPSRIVLYRLLDRKERRDDFLPFGLRGKTLVYLVVRVDAKDTVYEVQRVGNVDHYNGTLLRDTLHLTQRPFYVYEMLHAAHANKCVEKIVFERELLGRRYAEFTLRVAFCFFDSFSAEVNAVAIVTFEVRKKMPVTASYIEQRFSVCIFVNYVLDTSDKPFRVKERRARAVCLIVIVPHLAVFFSFYILYHSISP